MPTNVTSSESLPHEGWNQYRINHPSDTIYHDPAWARVIASSFGHRTYFITLLEDNMIRGVLPLVFLKSRIFGKALVSMPYFNYGGVLADNDSASHQLINGALQLKAQLKAHYIELRQTEGLATAWPVRSHKVNMWLKLPENQDELWKNFKSKLRNQIRRPEKEGCSFCWGHLDLLGEFYAVFSENMRDLGTPVYSQEFFEAILKTFPDLTNLAVVRFKGKPIAAGFLIRYRDKMEIPWASSLRRSNHISPNMLLYWGVLQQAITAGMKCFDFGRSTVGSRTYAFKEQWGSQPQMTIWVYPGQAVDDFPEHSPESPKFHWATQVWKRLPLFLTNSLGPRIVKNIP